MEERGADSGAGEKPTPGSALRGAKEADGLTMERQEDPLMTGEKIPQEKEGPGRKSGHLKEPRVRREPRPERTCQDEREELAEGPKEEKAEKTTPDRGAAEPSGQSMEERRRGSRKERQEEP